MHHSLARRLTLISLLSALLILVSWSFFMSSKTREVLVRQRTEDYALLLERSGDYLSLYAEGLNTALLNLSDTITLTAGIPAEIEKALNSFQGSNSNKILMTACVLSETDLLCTRQPVYEIRGGAYYFDLYRSMLSVRYTGIRWTEPYYSAITLFNTVTIYKPVDAAGQRYLLIVEINIDAMLADLIATDSNNTITWAVLSKNGLIVSTSDDYTKFSLDRYKHLSRQLLEEQLPALLAGSHSGEIHKIGSERYLINTKRFDSLNWTLAALTRTDNLYAAADPLISINLFLGGAHILLLAVTLLIIGNYYTYPLKRIADSLKTAEEPFTLNLTRFSARKDEIGFLAQALTGLIDRINTLRRQQAETQTQQRTLEINMLQAQIHPHFLGNTLACIASLVKEGKVRDVQDALHALIKLLNYSIARMDEKVELRDELKCIDAYIALRRMRMKQAFDFEVDIPGRYLSHIIPRLLLQPIVENAIVHGISQINTRGRIGINGYEHDGRLYLQIEDNGGGVSQERLDMVLEGSIEPSVHAHGIGIKNVFERLRLSYPDSTGSRIEACASGVRVILDLGALTQGE